MYVVKITTEKLFLHYSEKYVVLYLKHDTWILMPCKVGETNELICKKEWMHANVCTLRFYFFFYCGHKFRMKLKEQ